MPPGVISIPPFPATPEQIAKARAYADQLIAQWRVEDVFENATTNNVPKVRHKPSGMTCSFDPHPGDQLSAAHDMLPRTDFAVCKGTNANFTVVTTIMRSPQPLTPEAATAVFLALFRGKHPDAQPYTGQGVELGTKGLPPIRTLRLVFDDGGEKRFAHIGVTVVGNWAIEEVATGPLDKAIAGDLAGGIMLVTAAGDIVKASAQP